MVARRAREKQETKISAKRFRALVELPTVRSGFIPLQVGQSNADFGQIQINRKYQRNNKLKPIIQRKQWVSLEFTIIKQFLKFNIFGHANDRLWSEL